MNYRESMVYLDELFKYGSVFGLETIKELLRRLGNPQDALRFIHVSGTNGKGSTMAYLSEVLKEAGYRTGKYLSPHLISYRERIQINGEMIAREELAELLTEIRKVCEKMEQDGAGMPSHFEVGTALAFQYFKEKKCDIVLMETGLGGTMDATNVVTTTILEVIAAISMDHMDVLGDTLEEIAEQKAGIIKKNTIVVSACQKPEAAEVLKRVSREQNCRLYSVENEKITDVDYGCDGQSFSYKNRKNIRISLAGAYQIKNAALALEAVEALRELGFVISDEQLRAGMSRTAWWGRFTRIASEPTVILDGAHNEDAARELRNSLELYFKNRRIFYIMGVFKDKEYRKVIDLTAPLAYHIVTVQTPDNPRALPAEELKNAVAEINPSVEAAESIAEAVEKLRQQVTKDDIIVIFGSLSFLGEAEKAVLESKEDNHG